MVNVKILHTSDWHLGRTLHGVDLHDAQRTFIDFLVDAVQQHDVAAVLISGDVYDRAIPGVETVQLFSDALRRLSDLTTVIVTPGNHDSASRLGFGAEIMRDSVRILAAVDDLATPVLLRRGDDEVAVYGIPYLDPDAARPALADEDGALPARSHSGVLTAALQRIRIDQRARPKTRTVVMAHAFVVGAQPSDSERDLSVGGVQSVPSGVFDGFDYVALGHLHGAQIVPVPESTTVARYSGSPLAFSFSERNHTKSVAVVDISGETEPVVELLPLPVPRSLTELRGTWDELTSSATDYAVDHWVKVIVTDPAMPLDLHAQIRARFPHVLQISHEPVGDHHSRATAPVVSESMSPAQVTADFVEFVALQPPDAHELSVIDQACACVRAAEVGA